MGKRGNNEGSAPTSQGERTTPQTTSTPDFALTRTEFWVDDFNRTELCTLFGMEHRQQMKRTLHEAGVSTPTIQQLRERWQSAHLPISKTA